MKKRYFGLIYAILFLFSLSAWGHGLIEKPASREQFCGVESKPHEVFGKLAHEKCRPIMSKADGTLDNSIYNFMAVLTHTTGRQGRTAATLTKNVCGFDAEPWGGGKTPWDAAIDWPTNTLSPGPNQFVWNISWGNHFGDTEEFAYWITKPDFQFTIGKELTWSDFEDKPFCLLKYDDSKPSDNPSIVADKANNKFVTTCAVPARTGRAVIYGEWGRNRYTFERFHSCIDVVFSGGSTPTPTPTIKAVIAPLPSEVRGASQLTLDASKSVGTNLVYQWTVSSDDPSFYTLTDADKPIAKLAIKNILAEQRVAVNVTVKQGNFSDNTSTTFLHSPATNDKFRQLGSALSNDTLKAGDKIYLRIIDKDGKDVYLPSTPIVLDAETAKPLNWAFTLAQAVNGKNIYAVSIGLLNATTQVITPTRSADNKVYVPSDSVINNAYVMVEKATQPAASCKVTRKPGASAWWMGYDVQADKAPILLDFTDTGIDLTKVRIDGVFGDIKVLSPQKMVINQKPAWVSKTNPGYLGFQASNYPPLATEKVAACEEG